MISMIMVIIIKIMMMIPMLLRWLSVIEEANSISSLNGNIYTNLFSLYDGDNKNGDHRNYLFMKQHHQKQQ